MVINNVSRYYLCKHLAWQIEPISETVYVIDNKNGGAYFFSNVEKDIWKMIYSKLTIKDIIDLLSKRYEVAYSQLEEDVKCFVNELIAEDLIYEI